VKVDGRVWKVLGHMLDSAANNSQRFVRASLDGSIPARLPADGVALTVTKRCMAANCSLVDDVPRDTQSSCQHIPEEKLNAQCIVGVISP